MQLPKKGISPAKKAKGHTHAPQMQKRRTHKELQLCLHLLDTWPFCYMCVVVLPCLTLNGAGEGEGVACCLSIMGATEEVGFQDLNTAVQLRQA